MTSVFYTIFHGYMLHLFQEYVNAAEQGEASQWARILAYYYTSHGDSWKNVDEYISDLLNANNNKQQNDHVENVVIYNTSQHTVVSVGDDDPDHDRDEIQAQGTLHQDMKYPISVNGKTIGTVVIQDLGTESLQRVEERVLYWMTVAMVWGGLATSAIALLLGVWMSRKITIPLKKLLSAIEQIGHGNMDTRVEIVSNDEFGLVGQAFNEMSERIYDTEQARRHLVADVAHELRTPLTIMQGQLELMQEGIVPFEATNMLPILDEVIRLSRLVDDLHQLSLAEVGFLHLDVQIQNIVYILHRIIDNFSFEAEDRGVFLQFNVAAELIEAAVDSNRITQVFVNLLGNAIRYTPTGGMVTVEVMEKSTSVVIKVSDTGTGIDAVHLPHIFDRFYRAHEDRSRETGGMGIGLAIAKEFIHAHGGNIQVKSEMGKGTQFVVEIPKKHPPSFLN